MTDDLELERLQDRVAALTEEVQTYKNRCVEAARRLDEMNVRLALMAERRRRFAERVRRDSGRPPAKRTPG